MSCRQRAVEGSFVVLSLLRVNPSREEDAQRGFPRAPPAQRNTKEKGRGEVRIANGEVRMGAPASHEERGFRLLLGGVEEPRVRLKGGATAEKVKKKGISVSVCLPEPPAPVIGKIRARHERQQKNASNADPGMGGINNYSRPRGRPEGGRATVQPVEVRGMGDQSGSGEGREIRAGPSCQEAPRRVWMHCVPSPLNARAPPRPWRRREPLRWGRARA